MTNKNHLYFDLSPTHCFFSAEQLIINKIMSWIKFFLLVIYVGSLAGCISRVDVQDSKHHILVDRILDVHAGAYIDKAQLFERIHRSDYLLLGETHDNMHHHQLHAYIIERLARGQRQASVSFEMISIQQGEMLKQESYSSSDELIETLNQVKNKWPYARDYKVIFDSVLAAGFDILAANLDLDRLIRIAMRGDENLPEDIRQLLKTTPFSGKYFADLQTEIVEAHCNMLPATAIPPMVQAQRIRDAVMSLSLLNSHANIKVLIAGSGHTRSDRGVPLYLRNHDSGSTIVSIAFIGIDEEAGKIDAYKKRWGGQGVPFDFVWFTPAVHRQQHPCDSLRQHGKRKKGDVQAKQERGR